LPEFDVDDLFTVVDVLNEKEKASRRRK